MLLTEEQLMMLISESFKFDWKDQKYKWINDKSSYNANTSLTDKDENNKPRYRYTEKLLPKSDVISYNLFEINNFNVTRH